VLCCRDVDHPHRQFVARGLAGECIDESGAHHRSDNNRHHKWNKNYVAIWRGGIITMRGSAHGTIAAGRPAALAERKGAAPI